MANGIATSMMMPVVNNYPQVGHLSNEISSVGASSAVTNVVDDVGVSGKYSVDSIMFPDDEAAGVLRNGEYVMNPTAHNINDYIKEGSNYLGNKSMNGQYMYVVDLD